MRLIGREAELTQEEAEHSPDGKANWMSQKMLESRRLCEREQRKRLRRERERESPMCKDVDGLLKWGLAGCQVRPLSPTPSSFSRRLLSASLCSSTERKRGASTMTRLHLRPFHLVSTLLRSSGARSPMVTLKGHNVLLFFKNLF